MDFSVIFWQNWVLDGLRYGSAWRWLCFLGGVGCEGEGPESVVVGSVGVAEGGLAGLG